MYTTKSSAFVTVDPLQLRRGIIIRESFNMLHLMNNFGVITWVCVGGGVFLYYVLLVMERSHNALPSLIVKKGEGTWIQDSL